jgi:hypothetical protein
MAKSTLRGRTPKSSIKTMVIYFSESKKLYTESILPKQSTKHSPFKFYNVYSTVFVRKDQNSGPK